MIENSVRNERAAPYHQIRIFKGIGECPNEKNTDAVRKAASVFLPLYIQRPCSPGSDSFIFRKSADHVNNQQ